MDVISKFTAVISKFTVISRFQYDFYRISSDFVISDGFLDFDMISRFLFDFSLEFTR